MYKEMSLPKDLLELLDSGILKAKDDDLTDELSQTIIDHRNAIVRYRPDLINTLLACHYRSIFGIRAFYKL